MKFGLKVLAALLGLIVILGGIKFLQIQKMNSAPASFPPTTVAAVDAERQVWESTLSSVGELEAVQGVVVGADLPGRVVSIEFENGDMVNAGDVLVQQDTSSEKAQLRAAEASAALAQSNLKRARELFEKQVTSQSELDAAEARYKEAVAQADNIRTVIDKKTITAPFAGRLGIRMINLGQDLASGARIVSLQTLNPIFVNFYLPQQSLGKVSTEATVRMTSDALPDETFTGKISAINSEIDSATRSVRIQAVLQNPEEKLLPGMFGKVEVVLPEKREIIAVPQTAISYATFGDSVFVVQENDKGQLVARQQFVQLGETLGDYVEVTDGVNAGDTVVSSGVFKLQNNAPIALNNDVQPEYEREPTPEDT